jgi:glutamyl-tRNA reductase
MMQIVATGLNHRTAPVELREQFAVRPAELTAALELLYAQPAVQEAVMLSTCNRVELYTIENTEAADHRGSASFFHEFFNVEESNYINHLYRLYDEKAVRHLFSVASSLDSMIVGEPQILGQVKDFYSSAQAAGTTGRILNALFTRAITVGKRTRTETAIGEMAVSVPFAAVELAKRVLDSLNGKVVGLLGRGKMCQLTARHLKRAGVETLYVINRDMDRAMDFAEKVNGVPVVYDDELDFLLPCDILICSTRASHHLIQRNQLQRVMSRRRNRMLFLIDISVPRKIDPAVNELPNVYLKNIDDLQTMVAENTRLRQDEAKKAALLIEEEVQSFFEWMGTLDVVPTIRAFREHLEAMCREELQRTLRNLGNLSPEQRQAIEQFSRSMVNKIAHSPTINLKSVPDPEKAMHYGDVLRHLFDLDVQANQS